MAARVKGGKALNDLSKKAKAGVVSYNVGFFPKAKYADGTPVALVGLWQEFGTRTPSGVVAIPERPFFRSTNKEIQRDIRKLVIKFRDPKTKLLDKKDASKIAAFHAGAIQQKITMIDSPPNSIRTIGIKGSSNPLIDTGLMRSSVTWELGDGR